MEKNNYKKEDAGCDKYGKQRLELALYLKNNVLSHLTQEWFIENGTLLGAWRNGKFIAHDDDFDYAILINNRNEINDIYEKIKNSLVNSKYELRLISTYSDKIEVYDKSYGRVNISYYDKNSAVCYNGSTSHWNLACAPCHSSMC